mgnify:CR=1 FL=1
MSYISNFSIIEVLDNKKTIFNDDIYITGIDYDNRNSDFDYLETLKNLWIDNDKFNILLYHSPNYIEETASFWYDLQLYWHTHAWQIFPFTLLVDFLYKYSDWFFKLWNTNIYVSDWAALWWPKMRFWSQNEITLFNIKKQ